MHADGIINRSKLDFLEKKIRRQLLRSSAVFYYDFRNEIFSLKRMLNNENILNAKLIAISAFGQRNGNATTAALFLKDPSLRPSSYG